MPAPIGSVEELAAETAALYAGLPDIVDPVSLERVLAGLVAFSHADRPGLAAALQPLLARYHWISPGSPHRAHDHELTPLRELNLIIGAAVAPAEGLATDRLNYQRHCGRGELPGPQAALMSRMDEIAFGVSDAPRPLLVSVPSISTGLLEPGELLSRLRRAAGEGWEPWPVDLMQALMRLPRDRDPATAARAASLGTPAGLALARRLSAGAPDPAVVAEVRVLRWSATYAPVLTRIISFEPAAVSDVLDTRDVTVTQTANQLILATVWSAGPGQPGSSDHTGIPDSAGDHRDPCELVGELTEPERSIDRSWHPAAMMGYETGWVSCWPMLLPSHRDVIAAHVAPYLLMLVGQSRGAGTLLPALARADGPAGPGMHLALGYGLAARDRDDRAAAADALITLAARGQLDGAAFGTQLGVLVARGHVQLSRVVPGLRELSRAGAQDRVWSAIAAMLPQILPPEVGQPPQRAGELLALGVDVAQAIRPAAALSCVDEIAARRGSSQLVVQARRLRDALSPSRR